MLSYSEVVKNPIPSEHLSTLATNNAFSRDATNLNEWPPLTHSQQPNAVISGKEQQESCLQITASHIVQSSKITKPYIAVRRCGWNRSVGGILFGGGKSNKDQIKKMLKASASKQDGSKGALQLAKGVPTIAPAVLCEPIKVHAQQTEDIPNNTNITVSARHEALPGVEPKPLTNWVSVLPLDNRTTKAPSFVSEPVKVNADCSTGHVVSNHLPCQTIAPIVKSNDRSQPTTTLKKPISSTSLPFSSLETPVSDGSTRKTCQRSTGGKAIIHQQIYEYLNYMQRFPKLCQSDRVKLKLMVETELNYSKFENMTISELHLTKGSGNDIPLLDAFSIRTGVSLRFLYPPLLQCLKCKRNLHINKTWNFNGKSPTQVKVHTVNGTAVFSKVAYRCKACPKGGGKDISYHVDMYGNETDGYKFYEHCDYIRASEVCFFEKQYLVTYFADMHHCITTMSGKAESYNEAFKDSESAQFCRKFVEDNSTVEFASDDKTDWLDEEWVDEICQESQKTKPFFWEMSRKSLSSALYLHLALIEAKDRSELELLHFGPNTLNGKRESFSDSLIKYMETVEDRRSREVYSHELCTLACQKRGCGRLYVADGCWKLHYPICMYTAKSLSKGIEDYIPHDCPKSPRYGKAFCNEHCRVIESLGVPTDLRPFIKYCGADPVNYNKEEKKKVDKKLKELGQLGDTGLPVSEVQGTSFLFKNETFKDINELTVPDGEEPQCNKDIGTRQCMQRRIRGMFLIISGGGIIRKFDPLFRSESPTQVAFILLAFLMHILRDVPKECWSDLVLAYDNMCNVDRMKVMQKPLPMVGYEDVWSSISKIIDRLHLRNHKRPACKELYNPDDLPDFVEANTMICEQTFSWLAKYKKMFCSLPRLRFHFLLHHLMKQRNRYTERCHMLGRYPLLPSVKKKILEGKKTVAANALAQFLPD